MRNGIYVADVNHNNHEFHKIDKKQLGPLFKKAIKTIQDSAHKKLSISELTRIMLILSKQKPSKNELEFMEELIYFIRVAEKQNAAIT